MTTMAGTQIKEKISHKAEPRHFRPSFPRFGAVSPMIVLVILGVTLFWFVPQIFTGDGVTTYSANAAPVIMLVLAGTFPILLGGIDLSIAAMATFSGVVLSLISPVLGWASIPSVILAATVIGAAHGYLRYRLQLPSFISSLGILSLLTGLALVWSKATAMPIDPQLPLLNLFGGTWLSIPRVVIVIAFAVSVLCFVANSTRLGRHIYAIGSNERATLMSGVNVALVYAVVYATSGFLSAFGGCMLVAQTSYSAPGFAANLLLPAIVGIVIGGTAISGGVGGIFRSLMGGLTATMFQTGAIVLGFPPAIQNMAFGLVIIVAVVINIDRRKFGIVK